jgi:acyl-CoA reductase-like NAD-dependent aldehyde dehydrogenase
VDAAIAAALMGERANAVAEAMARETGKAVKDVRAKLLRSEDTKQLSAKEVVRIKGEHVPLDQSAMEAGKIALMLRFPVGVLASITPVNAPFNLAAHKLSPATEPAIDTPADRGLAF